MVARHRAEMGASTRLHTKVSRDDWIQASLAAIVEVPLDQLKVLTLANSLDVSRSSFYWYFSDRDELLGELLSIWERNTQSILERSSRNASTAAAACLGVFECWADVNLYNPGLDLAVRDWVRRSVPVSARVERSDHRRHTALADMFGRYGFNDADSTVRARLLYHSQVGYYSLGTYEPADARLAYLPYYVHAMAGQFPTDKEVAAFKNFLATVSPSTDHH
jgi:AcrR family transcriptional regulator